MSDLDNTLEYMSESLPLPGQPLHGEPCPAPEVPLERLEAQICELAGHLTAATCRFLLLVGDFDARRGWESWELPSCAAWLAWKCQIAPGTAREHVRVARALPALPLIRAEFAAARLSYAKVRALTRIATPATEEGLAELAEPMTGGQLDRFARAHRQVSRHIDQRARAARRVTWRIDDEDGSLAMTVRLPAVEGQVLVQALRAAAADLDHPHHAGHDDGASAEAPGTAPGAPEADGPQASGPQGSSPGANGPEAVCPQATGPHASGPDSNGPEASSPASGPEMGSPVAGSPEAVSLADALAGISADYQAGKIAAAANPGPLPGHRPRRPRSPHRPRARPRRRPRFRGSAGRRPARTRPSTRARPRP